MLSNMITLRDIVSLVLLIFVFNTHLEVVHAQKSCGKAYHLEATKPVPVSFNYAPKEKQKCTWTILGDVNCEIELTCKIDLQKSDDDCSDDSFKVSDGSVAAEKFCGKQDIVIRASPGLRDLFAVLESSQASAGIACTAKCASLGSSARRLQKEFKKKYESRCVCGIQNKDDRIVGGEDAKANEFPWQAAIVYANTRSPNCGASLINDRWVLTAAHCFWFDNKKPSEIDVLINAHVLDMTKKKNAKDVALGKDGSIRSSGYNLTKRTDADEKTQRFKVLEIINHPFFTENYDYDYALLKLDGKISLNLPDAPTPICLPPGNTWDNHTLDGKYLTVVGWGMSAENSGGTTRMLQKLDVPFINFNTCSGWMPKMLTQRMICAGYQDGVKDACTGDSGGPLILKTATKQFMQYGIVSWGEGCARAEKPGVYSRVTEMMQWIHFTVGETDATKWCLDDK